MEKGNSSLKPAITVFRLCQKVNLAIPFKRLSSYALDHPLYRALKEFGRIIKSQFILTYFDDAELRQRIEMQLSRVEQANKFSAAVFFDNDHAFQDGSLHQQEVTVSLILDNTE